MSNNQSSSNQFPFISGMTENELLMQALEESAKLHQTTIGEEMCSRSFHAKSQSGMQLLQLPIVNQFHPQWNPLISKYSAPSAICGYTAIACARIIAALDPLSLTKEELQQRLRSITAVSGHVEHSMRFIHDCRKNYIQKTLKVHPSYVLDIDWDDDLKWRVAYRFKVDGYIDLQEFLQKELNFIPQFITVTDFPSQPLFTKVFQVRFLSKR